MEPDLTLDQVFDAVQGIDPTAADAGQQAATAIAAADPDIKKADADSDS